MPICRAEERSDPVRSSPIQPSARANGEAFSACSFCNWGFMPILWKLFRRSGTPGDRHQAE